MPESTAKSALQDVPAWIWIGLPIASLLLMATAPMVLRPEAWGAFMLGELGILEIATLLILLPPIALAVILFHHRRFLPGHVGWVLLLGGLAVFYFAGEEVSWGQHYLRYSTPESVEAVNR